MLQKKSRYDPPLAFSTEKQFAGIRARKLSVAEGRVEHSVSETDRLDHLANRYYKLDRRWWRVMDANPEYLYAAEMLDQANYGDVILIPAIKEAE